MVRTAIGRAACRVCGVVLDEPERQICEECLPTYDRERTEKLSSAGKATLAAMRESSDDPARSPEATAKKQEKSRYTSLAMRAWERERGPGDPEVYEREVFPKIQRLTVPQQGRPRGRQWSPRVIRTVRGR